MLKKRCLNCNTDFKWIELEKAILFSFEKVVVCKKCNKKNKFTISSRIIIAVTLAIPLLLALLSLKSDYSKYSILIFILMTLLFLLVAPLFVSFSRSDK